MEKYIVIKDNLIENFILAETSPTPQSGETILLASNYNVVDLNTPYDSTNDVFLTKFKGQLKPHEYQFTSPTNSIDLIYTHDIVEVVESNIKVKGSAHIDNFNANSLGASFDLILNEELIASPSNNEIIELTVDRSITDTRGYTTIVSPFKIEYISGSF